MARLREMLDRLPTLYRDGELVTGVLGAPALQLEILDEDLLEVQRSHFFDATLEREEAARLADVLDIPLESWQTLSEYRTWVHALRNARLRHGAVTVRAITQFVDEYMRGFQRADDIRAVPDRDPSKMTMDEWMIRVPLPLGSEEEQDPRSPQHRAFQEGRPVFLENPPQRRFERVPSSGGIEPLHQFQIVQRGLDESYGSFMMVGLPGEPECTPAVINVTTGQALIYLDKIETGKRLWINSTPDGSATAELEGTDVTAKLVSVSGLVPGQAWSRDTVDPAPKAIRMVRGENRMWFLPIAHYNSPGLDRYLLALADLMLKQGRYDQTGYDRSLFYQSPAAQLRVSWVETRPATFEIQLPAGTMLSPEPPVTAITPQDRQNWLARWHENREQLLVSLNQGVRKLRGAGIDAEVKMLPLSDTQRQHDRLVMILPKTIREQGTMGADRLVESGGTYDVTDYEQSIFR